VNDLPAVETRQIFCRHLYHHLLHKDFHSCKMKAKLFALYCVALIQLAFTALGKQRCAQEGTGQARVAVGFFGMSKSLRFTMYTFERYVFKELEVRNISYDIFWSTMAAVEVVGSRGSNYSLGAIDPYEVRLLDPCQVSLSNQELVRHHEFGKYVKNNKVNVSADGRLDPAQDPFHDNFTSVKNALCAYYAQSVLARMISAHEKTHNFKYDAVVALRPDTAIMRPIDLPMNLQQIRAGNNTLWVPSFQPFGGYNDRAAYGSREVMSIYLNRGEALRDGKYSARTISERLVRRMVVDHNMTVEMSSIRVLRVRQNGFVAEPGRVRHMNVSEEEYYRCVNRTNHRLTVTC